MSRSASAPSLPTQEHSEAELWAIALGQIWNFHSYVALNSLGRRTISQTDNGGDHMSRRFSACALSVCCLVSITASAQRRGQSATRSQGIMLDISIVETNGVQHNEIEKAETRRDQLNRLIADGRARVIASLQVRTRTGERFSARVGERIPQNTGLAVEGISTAAGDGLLDIRLKIEMTGPDRSTGSLTSTFTQRTFTDVVRMKKSETAMLMGFIQPEKNRKLSLEEIASGTTNSTGAGFMVLLTTKPVQ